MILILLYTGRIMSPSEQVAYNVLFVQANPAGGYDHYGSFLDKYYH